MDAVCLGQRGAIQRSALARSDCADRLGSTPNKRFDSDNSKASSYARPEARGASNCRSNATTLDVALRGRLLGRVPGPTS